VTVSSIKRISFVFVLPFFFSSCSKDAEESPANSPSHPIRGEVVAIDSASSRIAISHQEIPGLMKAMTMPFRVKNSSLLKTIVVGDSIEGALVVSKRETYLDTLSVFWKNPSPNR
jgi:protein SCO1/2